MPYSDRREAGDHCARVSHQDRGPEQDSGGHEQPEAEAPHGVPGGTEYTVQAEQYSIGGTVQYRCYSTG